MGYRKINRYNLKFSLIKFKTDPVSIRISALSVKKARSESDTTGNLGFLSLFKAQKIRWTAGSVIFSSFVGYESRDRVFPSSESPDPASEKTPLNSRI